MPLLQYLSLLKVGGKFIMVGAPEEPLPPLPAFPFISANIYIGGSAIGSPADISEMLEVAAKEHIKGWVETRPMKDVNQAVIDMDKGKARYRYCLVNEKNLSEVSY
jgi:alcohol dehydrogenase (NADP+)